MASPPEAMKVTPEWPFETAARGGFLRMRGGRKVLLISGVKSLQRAAVAVAVEAMLRKGEPRS
jgi:hypothetical protein